MKQLYLVRHAKSDWNASYSRDFTRPLSKRGAKDAERIGKKLAELNWLPQKILCSTAERTQQTAEILCQHAAINTNIIVNEADIYEASMNTLINLITSTSESTQSLMLIGHNPSIEMLLLALCHNEISVQANGKVVTTGNIAKVNLSTPWCDLKAGSGELIRLLRPKEI
ncbi:MAG TPA: histidine phosphatase family protein [Leucothrix mucor]|nr:histidine phosphatase family protein [Leucothrix mucor]